MTDYSLAFVLIALLILAASFGAGVWIGRLELREALLRHRQRLRESRAFDGHGGGTAVGNDDGVGEGDGGGEGNLDQIGGVHWW